MSQHAYATTAQFKSYLSSSQGAKWTEDDAVLRLALEASSERIDRYLGNRTFQPTIGARVYPVDLRYTQRGQIVDIVAPTGPYGSSGDAGFGSDFGSSFGSGGVTDYWLSRGNRGSHWLFPSGLTGNAELDLEAWLLSVSAVTLTPADGSASATTLVKGATSDYQLFPPEGAPPSGILGTDPSPAGRIVLMPTRANALLGVAWVLTVSGTWGWQNTTLPLDTLGAAITDTTSTGISLATMNTATAGQTLLIDAEQMYIVATPTTTTATVVRGANGTTAATHLSAAPVSVYQSPSDVAWAALEIARNRWRERLAGNVQSMGTPDMQLTRPGAEERAILKRLDSYLKPQLEASYVPYFA